MFLKERKRGMDACMLLFAAVVAVGAVDAVVAVVAVIAVVAVCLCLAPEKGEQVVRSPMVEGRERLEGKGGN
jgi:hypothetical protein